MSYKDANEAERGNLYPAGDVNTLTLNNLTPGEEYKVHIRSRYYDGEHSDSRWSGPWTEVATQRVKDHPPAAPTGLTESQVSHNSLTLSWDDPQNANITGYRVMRGTDGNSLSTIEDNTQSDSTSFTDSTVEPETIYHYAILALSQDGDGAESSTIGITTPAETTVQNDPPAAPTGLNASEVSHDSLTLTWDDPQDVRITGYRILRGTNADSLATLEEDTGSSSTLYTDATVEPETNYFYAVNALSADGDGDQSRAISATTPAAPQSEERPVQNDPPEAPTDLTASSIEHDSLTLTWDDPQDDSITGHRILRGIASKNLPTIEKDTRNSSPSFTDNTRGEATAYFYQVVALRANTESPKSATIDVATPASNIRSVPRQSRTPSTQTLVSNIDRATHYMEGLVARDLAQGFKTGPHAAGYNLSSVDIYLTGRSPDLTVKLLSDSASGSEVATLTPSSWEWLGHDVYTFVPPANTNLTANTHYWILVKGSRNGWFHATTGTAAALARGWELADSYDYRSKYLYAADGTQSINTGTEFRQFPGNLSLRINRLNNVATGQLTISGTPETQQTLTAVATSIEDDDGGVPATLDYQWMRYSADGTAFETNIGTNSIKYTLVLADEGKKIRVQTSFVDLKNNDEGPFLSDAYPSGSTITAPTSYTTVSNTGQTVSNNQSGQISTEPHAQAFTTSGETAGYILSSINRRLHRPRRRRVRGQDLRRRQSNQSLHRSDPADIVHRWTAGIQLSSQPDHHAGQGNHLCAVIQGRRWNNGDPARHRGRQRGPHISPRLVHTKPIPILFQQPMDEPRSCLPDRHQGRANPNQTSLRPTGNHWKPVSRPDTHRSHRQHHCPRRSGRQFLLRVEATLGNRRFRGQTSEPTRTSTRSRLTTWTRDSRSKSVSSTTMVSSSGFHCEARPGRTVSEVPSISNTAQNGNSHAPMSTEVAQSFTTGQSPNGYQLSSITIFYGDEEQRHIDLKVCETASGGSPTADCWNLNRPRSFVPGPLQFNVPSGDFRIMDRNTTYAAVLKGPRPRTVETTVETACPQTDPDFTESCVHEVMVTVIVAAEVGVTTSDGEDPLSSQEASIRNAYQQNNEGTWQDSSSGEAIRIGSPI